MFAATRFQCLLYWKKLSKNPEEGTVVCLKTSSCKQIFLFMSLPKSAIYKGNFISFGHVASVSTGSLCSVEFVLLQ